VGVASGKVGVAVKRNLAVGSAMGAVCAQE
jgi:hypothetical protein